VHDRDADLLRGVHILGRHAARVDDLGELPDAGERRGDESLGRNAGLDRRALLLIRLRIDPISLRAHGLLWNNVTHLLARFPLLP
jgi:hypothetical protein